MAKVPVGSQLIDIRRKGSYDFTFLAKTFAEKIDKGVTAGMRTVAPEMQEEIRQRAPRKTGRLAESVRVIVDKMGIVVKMIYYGGYVENGTHKMRAHPFVKPVMISQRKRWLRKIARVSRAHTKL